MARMLSRANAAGVVIYTIDARGLQTGRLTGRRQSDHPMTGGTRAEQAVGDGPRAEATSAVPAMAFDATGPLGVAERPDNRPRGFIDSQESLKFIADQTGGLAIENTNDLNLGISRILDDQQGYYLLGYTAPTGRAAYRLGPGPRQGAREAPGTARPGTPGIFRSVRHERPQARVRRSPRDVGDVPVRIWRHHGAPHVGVRRTTRRTGSYVRSLVFIDPGDLHFEVDDAGKHTARFQVLLMAIGDNGKVLDGWRREVPLALTDENFRLITERGIVVTVRTAAKEPGPYQMRAAVESISRSR